VWRLVITVSYRAGALWRFLSRCQVLAGPRYWRSSRRRYRTASHERSPPSEAAEPVLVWSATGRSATGNPGSREAPFRYARHKPHSFSGTLLNGPLDIGMSPRFVEPPASPPGPRYWAQQPQEGYRTASHERSPPSEAAEPVLVWSATGRSATGNPGSREAPLRYARRNVRLSPGHSFFSRRKIRSVPPLRGTPRCAPWHREERTDTLPYI
jgi:hypothetical protein